MTDVATVSIQRAESYDPDVVRAAITEAVESLGGWRQWISPGDRVLVKPNCISAAPPEKPAQTHPAVIIETVRQLKDLGAKPFVGDSPAWGSLEGNLDSLGALEVLRKMDVAVVPFKHGVRTKNPHGKVFESLVVDKAALDADAIINLPKFKSHRQLVLTVAIKNMFGCVAGRRKAWWHVKAGSYDNYFGRMLVETFQLLRPVVSIIDGIVAMEGPGPMKGSGREMGLILASTDGPALERVAAEVVCLEPDEIRTLRAARELGVGIHDLERITIVGADIESARIRDFAIPRLVPIGFSLPRFVKGTLKQAWTVRKEAQLHGVCSATESQ